MNKTLQQLKDNNVHVLEIKKESFLKVLQGKKGEIVYCEENDKFYTFNGKKWIKFSQNSNVKMSAYELNKALIQQLPPLTPEEEKEKCEIIHTWRKENNSTYIMMLGREINYYTVFVVSTIYQIDNLGTAVLDCLHNIGTICSIEINDDNAIEIWVKPTDKDEVTVLYVFPYDNGIVTIGE